MAMPGCGFAGDRGSLEAIQDGGKLVRAPTLINCQFCQCLTSSGFAVFTASQAASSSFPPLKHLS